MKISLCFALFVLFATCHAVKFAELAKEEWEEFKVIQMFLKVYFLPVYSLKKILTRTFSASKALNHIKLIASYLIYEILFFLLRERSLGENFILTSY